MNTVEMKSPRLAKVIETALGDAYSFLKDEGAFLAGGAITSLFCNREITDFDIYLPSKKAVFNLVEDMYSTKDTNLWVNHVSRKAILTKSKNNGQDIPVQFILCQFASSVESIFQAFDFTVCMGAYDFTKEVFVLHEDFLTHNSQRVLKFNAGTLYPIVSLLRVGKYQTKGYSISKPDLTRIALTCSRVDLSSWDQVEDQLGGMYGLEVKDVFDMDKPCSTEEVISQLENIQVDLSNYNASPGAPLEEEGLLKYLFATEIAEIEATKGGTLASPPVFHPDKYYKCVSRYWQSAARSPQIDYKLGSTVNGGVNGIWVHKNPYNPAKPGGYLVNWVELTPKGENTVKPYESEQLQVFGDLEVTKQFIHDPKGVLKPTIKDKLHDYFNRGDQ